MICAACRVAGEQNKKGQTDKARAGHTWCLGGTQCDCQHVVGRTAKAGKEAK